MVVDELEHGLWFAVFSGYSYTLMFVGMSLLLATALRASGVHHQLLLIFVAILFPLGIDLLETIEALSALRGFDHAGRLCHCRRRSGLESLSLPVPGPGAHGARYAF